MKSHWDICDPTPKQAEPVDRAERSLLAAVLNFALDGARQGDAHARHWLTEPDFALYCSFLNLNTGKVRSTIDGIASVGKAANSFNNGKGV
jgi:hypothetical protein